MSTFVTADLHFNHAAVLRYAERPWESVDAMNEGLIEAWNSTVGKGDTVFVCGDFAFKHRDGGSPVDEIFARLAGNKHLIVGNHDAKLIKDLPWMSVSQIKTIRWGTGRAVCCHFPLLVWDNSHRGYLMLHGHSHGNLNAATLGRRFDVGVDALGKHFDYAPIPTAYLDSITGKKFKPLDHHA